MDGRTLGGIDWLHQIDLDASGAPAHHGDVFVDVLALAPVVARQGETEQIDPERAKAILFERAHGDLLQTENSKGSIHRSYPCRPFTR